MTETPKDAAHRLAKHKIAEGFVPEALHVYRDATGAPIYWRVRAKHPNGEKWVRPMRLSGHGYELKEPDFPQSKKPLYRLDKIASEVGALVWIVEGEKAADALTKAGLVATTSGSADSAADADWSPLGGRTCRLWADNDGAGAKYMTKVATCLEPLGCVVSTLDVAALELPPKGDAADWLDKWLETHSEASTSDFESLPVCVPQPLPYTAAEDVLARVEMLDASLIVPEAVTWFWDGWLAAGKLHILAGPPGTGKTTAALALGATLTIGGRWPDGTRAPSKRIALWSGEDSGPDVLVPRLMANGADCSKARIVGSVTEDGEQRAFDPATDVPLLRRALAGTQDLGLLIIDPIVSAVAGDAHKSNDVRRSLQPLADLAEATGCAILGISHFSKGTGGRDPVERVTGSIAFGAAARIVIGAAKRTEDEGGGRILVRAKNNLGPDTGGFCYDVEQVSLPDYPDIQGSRIVWGSPLDGTAKALLATAENDQSDDERTEREEAADWLSETLIEAGGQMSKREVIRLGERAGYKERTLERARIKAGVSFKTSGFGRDKCSNWQLGGITSAPPIAPYAPATNGGGNGGNGGGDGFTVTADGVETHFDDVKEMF